MECPVCLEVYNTPLLLPGCGHTICRTCAEALITDGNFLRCPECRLVYQLRQGIKSLPKNVALQRTIEERGRSSSRNNIMCEQHPDDAVSLYCKTCEKSICLKCFFSNTLRKGQSMHTGHQVDTSEDAFTKEKRMLEETVKDYMERRAREREYVQKLEQTTDRLQKIHDEKMESIENNKNEIISKVKQTTNKLKFTLKGSMVRDSEFLQMALQHARERLAQLETAVDEADDVITKASVSDKTEVNILKKSRRQLEDIPDAPESERPVAESFLKISNFDTDVKACMDDPKKALSYQTEAPRTPQLVPEQCVISDQSAYIIIKYNETVRVKSLNLHYKEAMYKGLSEKQWKVLPVEDFSRGYGRTVVTGLQRGTMYRMYTVSSNDFGESAQSSEMRFRTVDNEIEIRTT